MFEVKAYGAVSDNSPIQPLTIERRTLNDDDVLINIKYVGVCYSDLSFYKGAWGARTYPLVPGHEIAGIVEEIGSKVTKYKVGDQVGVGCLVDSCGHCEACLAGEEDCEKRVLSFGSLGEDGKITQGGYSQKIVVKEHFVLKIPNNLNLANAAPLMCAGTTTYSPLKRYQVGPGSKVAIIGLGGLGHLAVRIAKAMGAKVSIPSRTLNKQEDGLKLGADHYYATQEAETATKLNNKFDLILNTVSAKIDLDYYLSMLNRFGTLVNVGAPAEPLAVNIFSLMTNQRKIAGDTFGGMESTQEMLNFCGEHNISADIEIIKANQINEAYDRILKSEVKFRFVIDNSTI